MGEIVNLRRARKRQASALAEAQASANRAAFGVSKETRIKAKVECALAEGRLEAHRRLGRSDAE